MNKYELAPFRDHHPFQVLPYLREEDVEEAEAGGSFPDEALIGSVVNSDCVFTVFCEGEPVGFFGYRRVFESFSAMIWMVGTDRLTEYPKSFLARSNEVLENLLEQYDYLHNQVYKGNTTHIRWLEAMGAELEDIDDDFYYFYIYRE